jgi:hypothetical protein
LAKQLPSRLSKPLSGMGFHMFAPFEIINDITETETIAVGNAIREINRLRKSYGSGRWRKKKGKATIRFSDGIIVKAELHWYESHGIGRKDMKIKKIEW